MSTKTPAREVYGLADAHEHPLAVKYGISQRQVRRAVETKRLAHAKPGGLRVLITAEDIEAWILGSRVEPTITR